MLPCERDIYSGFILKSEDLSTEILLNQLPKFLKEVETNHYTRAVKVNVNYDHAYLIPLLKQMGFEFFMGDSECAQWVYRNGSPLPERAIVSSLRAHVLLVKDNKVLVTEQKCNAELVGKMLFPGGNINLEELPYDGGVREVKEEVGLNVLSMQLMGILSRLHVSICDTTDINFYYICRDFNGEVLMQQEELAQLVWVPLETLAHNQEYEGLSIGKLYNTLASHVLGATHKPIYTCAEMNLSQPGYLQLIAL